MEGSHASHGYHRSSIPTLVSASSNTDVWMQTQLPVRGAVGMLEHWDGHAWTRVRPTVWRPLPGGRPHIHQCLRRLGGRRLQPHTAIPTQSPHTGTATTGRSSQPPNPTPTLRSTTSSPPAPQTPGPSAKARGSLTRNQPASGVDPTGHRAPCRRLLHPLGREALEQQPRSARPAHERSNSRSRPDGAAFGVGSCFGTPGFHGLASFIVQLRGSHWTQERTPERAPKAAAKPTQAAQLCSIAQTRLPQAPTKSSG